MIATLIRAIATAKKKALVSDLNKLAKPSLIFDHGDDNSAASSKIKTTTITQTIIGSWNSVNNQPKVLYVTSSSVREIQGNFFKVGIHGNSGHTLVCSKTTIAQGWAV